MKVYLRFLMHEHADIFYKKKPQHLISINSFKATAK